MNAKSMNTRPMNAKHMKTQPKKSKPVKSTPSDSTLADARTHRGPIEPEGPIKVRAAGAVVFRGSGKDRRVLLEHRPHYNDWTLPKGKPNRDEQLPVTAVREVAEETGVHVRLGLPLPSLHYMVGSGHKQVRFWLGHETRPQTAEHDSETDQIAWPTIAEAAKLLTYGDEAQLLSTAVEKADTATATLVLTRHGKALARKVWTDEDTLRPLAKRGERQAKRLVALLSAYGVGGAVSSSSVRCMQTLEPFTTAQALTTRAVDLLSEDGAIGRASEIAELMWQLRSEVVESPDTPQVVCGHRPVLPDMQAGLHIDRQPMSTAQSLVIHLNSQAEPVAVESIRSPL